MCVCLSTRECVCSCVYSCMCAAKRERKIFFLMISILIIKARILHTIICYLQLFIRLKLSFKNILKIFGLKLFKTFLTDDMLLIDSFNINYSKYDSMKMIIKICICFIYLTLVYLIFLIYYFFLINNNYS